MEIAAKNRPRIDCLHITSYWENSKQYAAVCCDCENRKLTIHENGLRCHKCGILHDIGAYEAKRKECLAEAQRLFYIQKQNSAVEWLKKQNAPKPKGWKKYFLLNEKTKKPLMRLTKIIKRVG